jgi:hypothetical protein
MPALIAAWTALCAALKSFRISATVLISCALVLSGVVGAEVFERTVRFSFLVFHIEGLGAQLADLKARDAAALKAAKAQRATVQAAQTKATASVMASYTPAAAAIAANAKALTKEISLYVTPKDDSACAINAGAVRLLDSAAGGLPAVPDAAGGPDDAPSGVALSELVGADIANDAAANANAQQLSALQAWIRAQAAAFATPSAPAAASAAGGR